MSKPYDALIYLPDVYRKDAFNRFESSVARRNNPQSETLPQVPASSEIQQQSKIQKITQVLREDLTVNELHALVAHLSESFAEYPDRVARVSEMSQPIDRQSEAEQSELAVEPTKEVKTSMPGDDFLAKIHAEFNKVKVAVPEMMRYQIRKQAGVAVGIDDKEMGGNFLFDSTKGEKLIVDEKDSSFWVVQEDTDGRITSRVSIDNWMKQKRADRWAK